MEVDPAPQVTKLWDKKEAKTQKALRDLASAVNKIGGRHGEMKDFSILQFCTVTSKAGRTGSFEVKLVVHSRNGTEAESVLIHSKIATRK